MEMNIGILMADLSGYTALTEVHGDRAAMLVINKFLDIAKKSLAGESKLLERAGDQLVIISEDADDLARTALALLRNSERESHFLPIHAGLHYGTVFEHQGHFYGGTLNLAARISARAKGNRILCSEDFIDAMAEPELYRTVYQGSVNFKNVFEAREIFELQAESNDERFEPKIDPICQMQLDEEELNISYHNGHEDYHFCSEDCKEIFHKTQGQLQIAS
jgi:adenylate cyclase